MRGSGPSGRRGLRAMDGGLRRPLEPHSEREAGVTGAAVVDWSVVASVTLAPSAGRARANFRASLTAEEDRLVGGEVNSKK